MQRIANGASWVKPRQQQVQQPAKSAMLVSLAVPMVSARFVQVVDIKTVKVKLCAKTVRWIPI